MGTAVSTDRGAWKRELAKQSRDLERFGQVLVGLVDEINAGMDRAGAQLPPAEKVAALRAVKGALAQYEAAVAMDPHFKPIALDAVKARISGLEQTFKLFGWAP